MAFVKTGGSKAEASRRFKVSRMTVHRYVNADKEGSLVPKPHPGRKKEFEDEALREEVKAHPSATLKRYAKALGVSHVSVWARLRRLGITLKKNA